MVGDDEVCCLYVVYVFGDDFLCVVVECICCFVYEYDVWFVYDVVCDFEMLFLVIGEVIVIFVDVGVYVYWYVLNVFFYVGGVCCFLGVVDC